MKKSKVWKFDNNIDTDQILPSQYLLLPTIEDMKAYAFEPLIADFALMARPGDIIVAGDNFGCGSSREQAPRVLKQLGIKAIIAKSFARIFYRNCINIGLPAIICMQAHGAADNASIFELNLSEGFITVDGQVLRFTALPAYMQSILSSGGLIEMLNEEDCE